MIKKIREELKITQKYLAQKIGVTQQQVSNWENRDDNIKIKTLKKILKPLDLEMRIVKGTSHESVLDATENQQNET